MSGPAPTLLVLGLVLLLGLVTDYLGSLTRLPRVSLLIGFGIVLGPTGLDLVPPVATAWRPLATDTALLLVGFLLGGKLSVRTLAGSARPILIVSGAIVVASLALMSAGLMLATGSFALALLLAATSTPTDPIATLDAMRGDADRGPFGRLLAGIVAIDDVWALLAFSAALALLGALDGEAGAAPMRHALVEIGGALALGGALGLPMAWLSGRLRPGEPTLVEALGIVFVGGGLAQWLEVSTLLTALTLGATVANLARHHERAFHEIEGIEWPFMILFFVLVGAGFEVDEWTRVGPLAALYVALRCAARLLGGRLGGALSSAPPPLRRWTGPALMAQGGLANGMALVAAGRFPEHADVLLPVVVVATIAFELGGPVATRLAVRRVARAAATAGDGPTRTGRGTGRRGRGSHRGGGGGRPRPRRAR